MEERFKEICPEPEPPLTVTRKHAPWREYFTRADLTIFISIAILAVYWVSVAGGFVYDDNELILTQPAPQNYVELLAVFVEPHYTGLPYYRPLTRLTILVQRAVSGIETAFPYHVLNVILAAFLGVVAWKFLRDRPFQFATPIAAGGALLLALHPVSSSAVHAITGREALLASIFMIASVRVYCRGVLLARVGAYFLFTLALLCREVAVVTPILFLAADALGLSGKPPARNVKSWALRYATPAMLLLIYLIVRSWVLADVPGGIELQKEFTLIPLSWLYALQNILMPSYDLNYEPMTASWFAPLKLLAVIVLMATLLLAVAKSQDRRNSVLVFGAVWFLATFLPTSNLLVQESPFAERHLILPLLGLLIVLLELLSHLKENVLKTVYVLGGVAIVGAAVTSFHRASYFVDEEAFYTQRVKLNPSSADALQSYGNMLLQRRDFAEAATYLTKSLEVEPNHERSINGLGYLAMVDNDLAEAEQHFLHVLQVNPRNAQAWNNIGTVYSKQGYPDKATTAFEEGLRSDPWHTELNYNYGVMLMEEGRDEEAMTHFQRTIRVRPVDTFAYNRIGQLYQRTGQTALAIGAYENAIKVGDKRPQTYNDFGVVLAQSGDFSRAAKMFQEALNLDPSLESAQVNLDRARQSLVRGN